MKPSGSYLSDQSRRSVKNSHKSCHSSKEVCEAHREVVVDSTVRRRLVEIGNNSVVEGPCEDKEKIGDHNLIGLNPSDDRKVHQ